LILVDLKTMDVGEYEAAPFYAAGADICTVLGVSGLATISGVIKAANTYNAEAQIDLINVPNKLECAREAANQGLTLSVSTQGLMRRLPARLPLPTCKISLIWA